MNPLNYNHSPDHLRALISTIGLSNNAVARLCGVQERQFRKYLIPGQPHAPYSVVFLMQFYASYPDHAKTVNSVLTNHYQKGLNNDNR
jgi:3-hydroxymyristoyl/3-hydroxydecanoyl-(acyl carrier protein) dehydratase